MSKLFKTDYIILFAVATFSLLVAFFYLRIPILQGDSSTYLEAMQYMSGEPVQSEFYLTRMLTAPLMLSFSLALGTLVGNLYAGMMIVNIIFYYLIVLVFYELAFSIFENRRAALLSGILFATHWCLYNFGTMCLADMGGWFFFVLSMWFGVKYYRSPENKRYYFSAVLAAIIGAFFKEYGALGLISLSCLILASRLPLRKKILEIAEAGLLFGGIVGLYHLWFFWHFHFSYFGWYAYNAKTYALPGSSGEMHTLTALIKVTGWVFFGGWILFLIGAWKGLKNFTEEHWRILLALLPASLIFLVWPSFTPRVAFIFVPWLILISGYGLSKLRSKILVALLVVGYMALNYGTPALMKIINLPF